MIGFIFALGLVVGVLDAASVIDIPNWINVVLIGGPVAFTVGLIAFAAAVTKW
jgi:hypothetical protein